MHGNALSFWGLMWVPLYLVLMFVISAVVGRRDSGTANDFLNASRSVPTWAASLSFLAYNCGSVEVIGMSAMAAQYGVQAFHFYWIGGIPGMVFMGMVVVPVYMRSGARSLPEFLELRYGPGLRVLNASLSLFATAALAGGALYALAHVFHVFLGYPVVIEAIAGAMVVMVYVLLGGIRATIHTSIFQLILMIAGLLPLLIKTFPLYATDFAAHPERWHLWRDLPALSTHATLDRFGVILGLGFVISFSYWCTDFVIVQRALTARTVEAARKVPLIAGFGKLLIAFLIVLPGVAYPATSAFQAGAQDYNEAIPRLMASIYSPSLLGLGAAALLASLMAGIAGNVSGFSAAWTEEIYRTRLRPGRTERHYIAVGRLAVIACFVVAEAAAAFAAHFRDLMEFLQMVVSLFYAPLFAVVLAAFLKRRPSEHRACIAICLGVATSIAMQVGARMHLLPFGGQMTANFYIALASFAITALACAPGRPRPLGRPADAGVQFQFVQWGNQAPSRSLAVLGGLLLLACLAANLLWW
jgi:SSS family solute:Na+ symporter